MTMIKIETLAIIRGADDSKTLAARLGAGAVVALAEDIFPCRTAWQPGLQDGGKIAHGYAAEIAALLKDGGIGAARAKYYSEKSVQVIKAVLHVSLVARAKGKTLAEKAEIFSAAKEAAFAELSALSSVPAIQAWCKKTLPSAKPAATPEVAPAPAPAPAPAVAPSDDVIDVERFSKAVVTFQMLAVVFMAGIHASQPAAAAAAKAGSRRASLKTA